MELLIPRSQVLSFLGLWQRGHPGAGTPRAPRFLPPPARGPKVVEGETETPKEQLREGRDPALLGRSLPLALETVTV